MGWAVALCLALLLAGCATAPPPAKPPAQFAVAPRAGSAFAAVEADIIARHGAETSAFRLLERNGEALKWRLYLIDAASHSLDLQYYVWFGDTVGQLLLSRVIAAADRGVRVRMLFDDLNTLLHDMTHVELRDEMLARIDGHPNIEIRVFNPWHERSAVGRAVEAMTDFSRLNRRMHNKQMVVDNRAAVIGGRNIGDEYFGLHGEFNFHDLDVLGVGPVARQASGVFDRYWNSDWVARIPSVPRQRPTAAMLAEAAALPAESPAGAALRLLAPTDENRRQALAGLGGQLLAGRSAVHTDSPSRAAGRRNHMPDAFRALLRSARREVLITNAYIIPDENFMADLRELAGRGVAVRLLTNSLSSHDVPAVNAHYEKWRRPILETGARLHELRADAAIQAELVDTPPVRGGFVGLHTKAMVIDRERSFIGSMNLDPRSEVINSEMGVIIDSPSLATALAARMERDMGAENSWQVLLDGESGLRWSSAAGKLRQQPARHFWQRVENILMKLLPAEYY